MPELSLTSIVCHAPNPIAAEVAGETVLMSLENSRCYGLGAIGGQIWKNIQAPIRISALVERLRQEYDAPPGEMERDVVELLSTLAGEGLIEIRSDGVQSDAPKSMGPDLRKG